MESIINIITIVLFLGYLTYKEYRDKDNNKTLIRELTAAIKPENIQEPDNAVYPEPLTLGDKDEFVPLEDIDPKTLLKTITKDIDE